jgi:TolB protein
VSQATPAPFAAQEQPTPAADPATAPIVNAGPGRIYFPVYDGQYRIYSANPDGSDRQLIRELASSPAASPDGRQVLYYSWEADQRGIHRVNANGTDDIHLSLRSEDTLPAWSPDGTKYVYSTRAGEGGDINRRAYTLRIASTATKPRNDPNPVVDEAQYPSWGPTEELVYRDCAFPDDVCGLALTNDDGSGKRVLTNINSTAPAWSPDGSRIVFMSNVGGSWDIWSVSPDGGSPQRLTDDVGDDGLPTFSPDGSKIAFVSQRNGQWGVWTIDLDGENETKLSDIGGEVGGPVAGNPPAMPGQTWLGQRISWR